MFKFELGQTVKDKITGFTGVILGRTEYATGCIQYGLSSRSLNKDGSLRQWEWFDEVRLVKAGKIIDIRKDNSGPAPSAPTVN